MARWWAAVALVGVLLLASGAGAPDVPRPVLVVQGGHWAPPHSVAFNPDGTLLASAGSDHTVALWDPASGLLLASLEGHSSYVYAVAFSPDGRLLASGSGDDTVRLWDVETGRSLAVLEGHAQDVSGLAFSPDGRWLASAGEDRTARLWEVASRRPVRVMEHPEPVAALAFSPDGRRLATGYGSQHVRLWEVATEAPPRVLQAATHSLLDLAWHPGGRLLATSSWDGCVRLWDVQEARVVKTLEGHMHPGGKPGQVDAVAFSPDGRTLAAGAEDGSVHLWDVASGIRQTRIQAHAMQVTALAFSQDGPVLASGGHGAPPLALWDSRSHQRIRGFQSPARSVDAVAWSRDALLTAGGLGTVSLWDLDTGVPAGRPLEGLEGTVFSATRTFDGALTVAGGFDQAFFWRQDGTPVRLGGADGKGGHSRPVVAVASSPDRAILATASYDCTARLWSTRDGALLRVLEGHAWEGTPEDVNTVAFSPDGDRVATGGDDGTVRLWDVATGREVGRLEPGVPPPLPLPPPEDWPYSLDPTPVTALAFAPDGSLVFGMADGQLGVADLGAGTTRRIMDRHQGEVTEVALSPDGTTVASASRDRSATLWDLRSGRLLHRLEGHTWTVESVAFHPGGKVLATASADGTARLWSVEEGTHLATAIPMEGGEWLAVSPEGFFDGSPAGMRRVLWRLSERLRDTAEPEQFFQDFYHPGLVSDVVQRARSVPEVLRQRGDPRAGLTIARKDRRFPRLALEAPPRADQRLQTVKVRLQPSPAGIRDVRLFRNDVLVARWEGTREPGVLEARVAMVSGPNLLTAYAFNRDDVKSPDVSARVVGSPALRRASRAHVLAIGVNRYADPRLDLVYAAPDARALEEALRGSLAAGAPPREVRARSLTDEQATRAGILEALARLAREAEPEDSVVLSFSGHGMRFRGRFYLVPQDMPLEPAPGPDPLAAALSDRDLEEALLPLRAENVLLILDACQSGQALEASDWRRGPVNARGLGQLAWEKGMDVLAASQSQEAALEAWRLNGVTLGHGLLTWSLLDSLREAVERRETLLVRRWLDAAAARVPRILEGAEGVVPARGLAGESPPRQTPRVFYRRQGGGGWPVAAP